MVSALLEYALQQAGTVLLSCCAGAQAQCGGAEESGRRRAQEGGGAERAGGQAHAGLSGCWWRGAHQEPCRAGQVKVVHVIPSGNIQAEAITAYLQR